jgi:pyrroloquinoline quinone biosynthesis protein B
MELFKDLSIIEKEKIHFIHFNHTNPLNRPASTESNLLIKKGFRLAKQGQIIRL